MKVWKLVGFILVLLLLVSCTGKTVRAMAPPPIEEKVELAEPTDSQSDTIENSKEAEVQTTDQAAVEIDAAEEASNAAVESPTEAPKASEVVPSVTSEAPAILVIESENAYTDAEKLSLLKEIDLLLEETLNDLNEGNALDEWDENMGGGQ